MIFSDEDVIIGEGESMPSTLGDAPVTTSSSTSATSPESFVASVSQRLSSPVATC